MSIKSFDDLFLHFLHDVYYAERQVLKALPKMARGTDSAALKEAFTHHREETQGQIQRLEQVFEQLGKRARGITCEAIKGLIEEGEEVVEETEAGPVRDAGLLACAQAIEHYEMARYGALIAFAKQNGQKEIAALLQENLDEEKKADALLSQLASKEVNKAAKAA